MQADLMPSQSPSKPWERDKWTTRHALVCDLHLLGKTNKQIAETLDYTDSTVSIILGDPRSHTYIQEARRKVADSLPDLMDRLAMHAHEALSEIVDEMRNSADERIRQRASFGIMDRAGYSPVQKVLRGTMPTLPEDLASRVEETMKESDEIQAKFRFRSPETKDESGEAA